MHAPAHASPQKCVMKETKNDAHITMLLMKGVYIECM